MHHDRSIIHYGVVFLNIGEKIIHSYHSLVQPIYESGSGFQGLLIPDKVRAGEFFVLQLDKFPIHRLVGLENDNCE